MIEFLKKYKFQLVSIIFILIAVTGLFEDGAIAFVKTVCERNLEFLGLVTELELILGSIQSINIPAVEGALGEINQLLNKAENYLVLVNIISVLQLMLLTISKSTLVKIVLVVCLSLTLVPHINDLAKKILILVLAINPGLAMFTQTIDYLSTEAQFSFGEEYAIELSSTLTKYKGEQSQILQEHEKNLTLIENSNTKYTFFKKLREDLRYDIQKVKTTVAGDYFHIRKLIRSESARMEQKLLDFCTMVLFCMLILPMGYAVIMKTLFNSLFPKYHIVFPSGTNLQEASKEVV